MRMLTHAVVLALTLAIGTSACAQANYQLTFDAPWSAGTHPGAYPAGAHFSPLIGGVHDASVSYWELHGIASNAIEQMAETGGTTQLRSILLGDINQGPAADIVQAPGISAPGSRTTSFSLTAQHPLLTLVTMIAPSPDWFVGVSGLDFRSHGQWIDSLVLQLENYDAGTDAGANFSSPNMDITPHQPISVLAAPLAGLPPVGTFTFTLMSSTALCDFDLDGSCGLHDLNELLGVGPIASGVPVEFGINNRYDLDGDGVINLSDRDDWLAGAAAENGLASPYAPADANLDGFTDGLDFVVWNDHRFTASLDVGDGDFNGDGIVDGADFIVWNQFKFTAADRAAVPEPDVVFPMLIAVAGYWRHRGAGRRG